MIRADNLTWFKERDRPRRRRLSDDENGVRVNSIGVRLANPDYQFNLSSNMPQCVLKVASFAKGVRARSLMEYVTRTGGKDEAGKPADLQFCDQDGIPRKGAVDVNALYEEWSSDFERKKKGSRREPRHVTHIILSADTDNSEAAAKRVDFAANDFLDEFLAAQGFEYIYVTHRDTDKPHVHVVVKNYNKRTGKKLHLSKETTFLMRQKWSEALQSRGVEAVATLRRDRTEVLDRVAQGIEDIQKRETWNDRVMLKASAFTPADRLLLAGRIDAVEEKLSAADRQAVAGGLQDLRDAVARSGRKEVRRQLVSVMNGAGKDIPSLRDELASWIEGNHVPDMTLRQRKGLARKVARMREEVKAATGWMTEDRREFMSALRDLDAAIRHKSRKDIKRSAEAALSKAGKDIESVRRHLSSVFVTAPASSGGRGGAKGVEFALQAAARQSRLLIGEIREAAETLRFAPLPGAVKKDIARRLREQLSSAKMLQAAVDDPKKLSATLRKREGSRAIDSPGGDRSR